MPMSVWRLAARACSLETSPRQGLRTAAWKPPARAISRRKRRASNKLDLPEALGPTTKRTVRQRDSDPREIAPVFQAQVGQAHSRLVRAVLHDAVPPWPRCETVVKDTPFS